MPTQRIERVEVVDGSCDGFHPTFSNPGAQADGWPRTPRFLASTLEG